MVLPGVLLPFRMGKYHNILQIPLCLGIELVQWPIDIDIAVRLLEYVQPKDSQGPARSYGTII